MEQPYRHRIVGRSRRTMLLRKELAISARRAGGVLLIGEVGAGKELCARTLHRQSARRRGPFRMVDCARFFPEDLTSIIFGSEDRPGTALLSRADRGTLYLVHPEEMVLSLQERILDFARAGTFAVGRAGPPRTSDVRIVAGTEKDLGRCVRAGTFSRELAALLAESRIEVAPLRDRVEDVASIVEHLLGAPIAERFGPGVLPVLERYPWPGNYDELIEEVERLLRTGYGRIETAHLRRDIVSFEGAPPGADLEILQVVREIEQCIEAFRIGDAAALDFAPYFWRGGPVPDQPCECEWETEQWENDCAW